MVYHSCDPLCHFKFRGRINICVFVVVALITILPVLPIKASVGGIVRVIPGSILILEEQAPVSVSDVNALWVMACKAVHVIDCLLRKGEWSEALLVQSFPYD